MAADLEGSGGPVDPVRRKEMALIIQPLLANTGTTWPLTVAVRIAHDLMLEGYGKLGPFCEHCAGPYPLDEWPGSQYAGHWDTCPNRPRVIDESRLDPKPYVDSTGLLRSEIATPPGAVYFWAFRPRPEYEQNREEYP